MASYGAVAAGHKVTAEAAMDVLRDGGNAFDAALAALFASFVSEAVLSSPGGGGFMMAYKADSCKAMLYDFFSQTPRQRRAAEELDFYAILADFGPATQEFHIGAGSTATPGVIPGAFAIHADLGSIPIGRLLEPAITAARSGIEMNDFHAYLFSVIEPILMASPQAGNLFAPSSTLLQQGERFVNPDLAAMLEALAHEGPELFSHGEVAKSIVRQSEANGGNLGFEDLHGYEVIRRSPLRQNYKGAEVMLNPAPSAGGSLIAFGLELLGDIDHPTMNELAHVMHSTNKARREGQDVTAMEVINRHKLSSRGTTHISVIDIQGNAASLTVSNGEGNGYMVDNCGFMLNNMLGEEDINSDGFHCWRPNTRLSSIMSPTIVRDGKRGLIAMGSGGSNRIRTAILQVIVNILDRRAKLQDAVGASRIHVEKSGLVSFENCKSSEQRDLLAEHPNSHCWPEQNLFFGGVHVAARKSDDQHEAVGDQRRRGIGIVL
jgi:gamma-glutamyltranspeptidase/glutathione hydrolase